MNDLSWSTEWTSVVVVDDFIGPNNYMLSISFDVTTDNAVEQNTAFQRIKDFVYQTLENSLMISHESRHLDYFLDNTEQTTVVFADKPVDLVVLATLFWKFTSIVEGRIDVNFMTLSSSYGDNISIHFDKEFAEEITVIKPPAAFKDSGLEPWWLRKDAGFNDRIMEGKPVLGIEPWPKKLQFASDKKKDKSDKPANWKPEIIDGGKTKH